MFSHFQRINSRAAACLLFGFAVIVAAYSAAEQTSQSAGRPPFSYPNPATVGTTPPVIHGHAPVPVTPNRYAGVSEWERQARIQRDICEQDIEGFTPPKCPLCENDPKTPCGECKMCKAGFPCEKTLCRHCVQPRSKNMGNSCDLTAGDEPCGTCDACREHRSDPCEHADNEYGPLGEFNPYHEPRWFAAIPRPILDEYNNGARKFPVYYNPAPYYRPTWNPSMFAGYGRPYTFRWSCPTCYKDPCDCTKPGLAGQVPYAFTCKFCKRNPCACAGKICDVTKPLDPEGISQSLASMNAKPDQTKPVEIRPTASGTGSEPAAPSQEKPLLDDESPTDLRETDSTTPAPPTESAPPRTRMPQLLDAPDPDAPKAQPGGTVS
jgi:hypothetical protein